MPAAFDLGKSLSQLAGDRTQVEERLAHLSGEDGAWLLVGYLWGRIESGTESAYDDFLDEGAGRALTPAQRLALTARGPRTDTAIQRANALSADRPVVEAVRNLFGLRRDMTLSELAGWLAELIPRVGSQED